MIKLLAVLAIFGSIFIIAMNLVVQVLVAAALGTGRLPAGGEVLFDSSMVVDAFIALSTVLVGILIIRSRPRNVLGWIILGLGAVLALSSLALAYTTVGLNVPSLQLPALTGIALVGAATWPLVTPGLCLLLLFFPTGHLLTRRWRWAVGFVIAATGCVSVAEVVLTLFILGEKELPTELATPIGLMRESEIQPFIETFYAVIYGLLLLAAVGVAVVGMLVRYRRSGGVERQQMKWLLYVSALFVIASGINIFVSNDITDWMVSFVGLGFPIAIGIAILRFHLFNIDLIIRKTLVYGIVAVLLAAIYFGSVILFQQVFAALSGQRSEVITVLSTLFIAALFVPVRNRVQSVIDRRFYRGKYDAQRVLSEFSTTVRDETDLTSLTRKLIEVVQETMQPKSISVWLGRADVMGHRKTWK